MGRPFVSQTISNEVRSLTSFQDNGWDFFLDSLRSGKTKDGFNSFASTKSLYVITISILRPSS